MPKRIGKRMVNDPDMPGEAETFEGPSKTLIDAHFLLVSALTGDVHPFRYHVEYATTTRFGKPLAHGLLRKDALIQISAVAALRP